MNEKPEENKIDIAEVVPLTPEEISRFREDFAVVIQEYLDSDIEDPNKDTVRNLPTKILEGQKIQITPENIWILKFFQHETIKNYLLSGKDLVKLRDELFSFGK